MTARPLEALLCVVLLAACTNSTPPGDGGAPTAPAPAGPSGDFADPVLAQCVMQSPLLEIGRGLDASGRIDDDTPAVGKPAGVCADNTQFRFGASLHDITGVVANTGGSGWENLFQVFSGLHTRQYARAFAIESPCNGQRVLFVSADVGLIWASLRNGVLAAIAADPELSKFYRPENLLLSATHTHQGPAGYSHEDGGNLFHYGYDDAVYQVIVAGLVGAIRRAHANIEANAQTAPIRLAVGELLDTNINRSLPAFLLNSEAERREFLDARGEEIDTDKRFVQLNLVRDSGSAVGVINWFGVHPTILGPELNLVSGDHKGYASLGFEKIMRARYDAPPGMDSFVAAFAQTNEGDASPNLFITERPWPDPTRGGGRDAYESNAAAGTKQLAKALELYTQGRALTGPVDVRFFNVAMDTVEISDPVVLASLRHPPELDVPSKRTCSGALGISFGAGAEDGPGPSQEGIRCDSSPDVIAAAEADFRAVLETPLPPSNPYQINIPSNLVGATLMCQTGNIPGANLACHAEKPVFVPTGQPILPFQIFRIGNLAIVGLPWEVTTIAGRRIRKTLLDELAPAGIDTVVIAGLANEFVNYLTTREEYSSQQYEGASTVFGPWTLAAVQQELRRLAITLREGAPAPAGPPTPADATPGLIRPPYNPSDTPGGPTRGFGAVVTDVPASAMHGETVRAEFQAGHPRNDLRTQASYVYAERQTADGGWEIVASDRDPELVYVWKPLMPSALPLDLPLTGSSTAEAVWTIPRNTAPGTYRLRHEGAARMTPLVEAEGYSGVSSPFTIAGTPEECP